MSWTILLHTAEGLERGSSRVIYNRHYFIMRRVRSPGDIPETWYPSEGGTCWNGWGDVDKLFCLRGGSNALGVCVLVSINADARMLKCWWCWVIYVRLNWFFCESILKGSCLYKTIRGSNVARHWKNNWSMVRFMFGYSSTSGTNSIILTTFKTSNKYYGYRAFECKPREPRMRKPFAALGGKWSNKGFEKKVAEKKNKIKNPLMSRRYETGSHLYKYGTRVCKVSTKITRVLSFEFNLFFFMKKTRIVGFIIICGVST